MWVGVGTCSCCSTSVLVSPVQVGGGVICGEGDAGVEDHPEVAMG